MDLPSPFYRELGSGPAVICLPCSASSSGQWRGLMERLADRFRVFAVDIYGSGKTAPWPFERPMQLADEVALLESVFDAAGDRFHLVGHSFGGAIALKTALEMPERVLSLTLYEPVFFSVLLADAPDSEAAREILSLGEDTTRFIDLGNIDAAAERFVDYWMGAGAWAATPESRRPAIAEAMRGVKHEWRAAFNEPTPLAALGEIDVPTLILTGAKSRASALAVARLVNGAIPRARAIEIFGVGHMAPVTHPEVVNPFIERFLLESGQSFPS